MKITRPCAAASASSSFNRGVRDCAGLLVYSAVEVSAPSVDQGVFQISNVCPVIRVVVQSWERTNSPDPHWYTLISSALYPAPIDPRIPRWENSGQLPPPQRCAT